MFVVKPMITLSSSIMMTYLLKVKTLAQVMCVCVCDNFFSIVLLLVIYAAPQVSVKNRKNQSLATVFSRVVY